jgi:heterotetrameric sarcosine oxidase gamma subunit
LKSAIRLSLILKERVFVADTFQMAECRDFGLATVMLRKNADVVAIGAAFQLRMPAGPTCTVGKDAILIGTGPGTWLAFAETKSPTWAAELGSRLPGASISDQSGGYVIFKIVGSAARTFLQRGAFIDLDPSAFHVGSVATTMIAHIGVVIWQVDDADTFHVALFRSFADSFREVVEAFLQTLNNRSGVQ